MILLAYTIIEDFAEQPSIGGLHTVPSGLSFRYWLIMRSTAVVMMQIEAKDSLKPKITTLTL